MKTLRLGSAGGFPCFIVFAITVCFSGCAHFPQTTSSFVRQIEEVSRVQPTSLVEQIRPAEQQPTPVSIPPAEQWQAFGSISLTSAGLLALIAMGVLVPASVPFVARLFALLVTRLPGLAGVTGVVSVQAFDAIVKAIERSKHQIRFANQTAFEDLHAQLARELDTAHKRLVRARKETFAREEEI